MIIAARLLCAMGKITMEEWTVKLMELVEMAK